MFKSVTLVLQFVMFACVASAQWAAQSSGTTVRLRGVSAGNSRLAWASGDKGTFARTTDGGRTWRAGVVPGAEGLDFRDVDAFGADTAYLLSIGAGESSRIYKTTDGGKTWALQFVNKRPKAFFDAMAFWDERHGVALSDPVDGRFLVIETTDGGRTWRELPRAGMPPAREGESAFAASGTCVAVWGRRHVWFGTGGPSGVRLFSSADGGRTWDARHVPLIFGEAAGVFSVVFRDRARGTIVGGNYTKEQDARDNAAYTRDGGRTWRNPSGRRPGGYRSAVAYVRATGALVAVGPSGSDISTDGGDSWTSLGAEGFHAVSFAPAGRAGWAVGEGGRVAKYVGAMPSRGRTPRRRR
ncbi:MAG TPA: hypothetical protein VEQ42_13105 [Pyrinomonadaceae bacterium]|nr:hypothetical protein [Pyrinomonadaceae bacterium]